MPRNPTSTATERARRAAATRRANRERDYWDVSDGSGRRPKVIATHYGADGAPVESVLMVGPTPSRRQLDVDVARLTGKKL